jgi:hypothetical protein
LNKGDFRILEEEKSLRILEKEKSQNLGISEEEKCLEMRKISESRNK